MNIQRPILLAALAVAMGACQRQPQEAVPAPAPAAAVRLTSAMVDVVLSPQGAGAADPSTGKFKIPVTVTNKGTVALSSAMNPPVNIGVQVMPAGDGSGGILDFSRTPLPEVKPGQTITVPVTVPVDARLNGHSLKIELVQEHVAWFSGLGQPGIKVGPYAVCDASLCPTGSP